MTSLLGGGGVSQKVTKSDGGGHSGALFNWERFSDRDIVNNFPLPEFAALKLLFTGSYH